MAKVSITKGLKSKILRKDGSVSKYLGKKKKP